MIPHNLFYTSQLVWVYHARYLSPSNVGYPYLVTGKDNCCNPLELNPYKMAPYHVRQPIDSAKLLQAYCLPIRQLFPTGFFQPASKTELLSLTSSLRSENLAHAAAGSDQCNILRQDRCSKSRTGQCSEKAQPVVSSFQQRVQCRVSSLQCRSRGFRYWRIKIQVSHVDAEKGFLAGSRLF